MFIAALLTIAKTWQQPKCLSTDKWIKKMWCVYIYIYIYIYNGILKWSEVAQLCPTLFDPMDCSLPGSSVRGIFQAIVLEWIVISFSTGSSQPRDQNWVSSIVDRRFTIWAMLVTQSCPTLCDLMDCSPPGSSLHEIFQARILEWVAISFSRGSSQPRDRTQVTCTVGRFFTEWATREAQWNIIQPQNLKSCYLQQHK